MTNGKPGMDQRELHLIALRDELTRHGVRCALDDHGMWPRLRIYCPGEGATAESGNNVVAAPIAGRWFFFWPWAEPIGSVTRAADAARRIIDDLCLDGDDGTGQPVTSLAVWRMLQHARAGISSVHVSGVPPGGAAAARHQPPRQSRPPVPRLGTPPRRRLVHLWIGWGLSGVGVLGLGFVPDVWLAGGVAFVTYGLDAYGSVMFNPLIQEGVPDVLLGRVSAVDYLFGFALSPLGLVAGGAAADRSASGPPSSWEAPSPH